MTDGNITIDVILHSKMTCKKLVFEHSSSDTKGQTNFSNKYWGNVTCEYVHSVNNLLIVSKEHIFKGPRPIGKGMASHHNKELLVTPTTHTHKTLLGCHVVLIDIP